MEAGLETELVTALATRHPGTCQKGFLTFRRKSNIHITQYNVPSAHPALLSLQKEMDEQAEQVKCLLTH